MGNTSSNSVVCFLQVTVKFNCPSGLFYGLKEGVVERANGAVLLRTKGVKMLIPKHEFKQNLN